MENCPLGFDKEMAPSCVCVRPAGLSGRLPASCRQRSLKSKVHREAKIPRQAGRDGSRELERQMQGLQRAHNLSGNRRERSLGFILPSLEEVLYFLPHIAHCSFCQHRGIGIGFKTGMLRWYVTPFISSQDSALSPICSSSTFSFSVLIGCVALRLCPLFMGRHQKALLRSDCS